MKHHYRSTHPSRYFENHASESMPWKAPTWIERNGEFIAALLGALTIFGCLGAIVGALIAGWLS